MVMVLVLCVPLLSDVTYAGYAEGTPFSAGNTNTTPAPDAYGQIVRIVGGSKCKATAAPPSYSEGDEVPLSCELDGDLRTNATGGGGGGAVTVADGADATQGATADAACAAGSAGTTSCKLRQISADIDAIKTSVQLLDDAISGTKTHVMMVDSSGNEVVIPTAGLTHFDAADASTNSTNVLNAAGTVYHYSLSNTTTTIYYLRMYNRASAPTCSSATGFVESIPIPPAGAAGQAGGRERIMNIGQAFPTGISYCITASSGSTANDAAAAGVFVTILYKAN